MSGTPSHPVAVEVQHNVVIYSHDPAVRDAVRTAVGRRPAADLGLIEFIEVSTGSRLLEVIDAGGTDLVILDGESQPTGGLGLAKQLKDEIDDCPPTLVLVARKDDIWLANWSLADAVLAYPLDAPELATTVCEQLRARTARLPVRRHSPS